MITKFYTNESYVISIPPHIRNQFSQLPFELQKYFDAQYKFKSKSILLAYALHLWAFGSSYAYRGHWVKQIFFWITAGGCGAWWIYVCCMLWYRLKQENEQLAEQLINDCVLRLRSNYSSKNTVESNTISKNTQPKKLDIEYNPAKLTIDNLAENFLIDYQTKTWEVKRFWQQDWENAKSERFYLLEQGHEQLFITSKYESFMNSYFCSRLINVHIIDSQLQNLIINNQPPKNIISYQGQQYYKEIKKVGIIFDLGKHDKPNKITQWDYYTEDRNMYVSISLLSQNKIVGYTGYKVLPNSFSDILPRSVST